MTDTNKVADGIVLQIDLWRDRLLAVPADKARMKPSEDRWSISEVIGHLVDSACNNHQRFVRAQAADALVFPKYDQNAWVAAANYREFCWESLIDLWCNYNKMLAGLIRSIPAKHLEVPCTITPYDTCTLGFLVDDYLDHLNHHLGILESRIA